MTEQLTGEVLVEDMTRAERARAAVVESVLPALADAAEAVDRSGEFHLPHVKTLADAGLLGLIVPENFGGMGGGLRDLAAATFAMGTACPSTALAYFFHCSSASRGLLPLEAVQAGLFDRDESIAVESFATKVLTIMGEERRWLANFASESAKSTTAKITISTEASPTDGGYLLNGVKAFGCATGVADQYLVTAKLADYETADGLALFIVGREDDGVSERSKWDAVGMRGTATHGIVLKDVFVADDDALTVPGAFVRMMQVSRGSFVGNQLAGAAVYAGAAKSVYDWTLDYLHEQKFRDTGEPIGASPFHQQLIGEMTYHLDAALLWMRRQLWLEATEPPPVPKDEVVKTWRLSKGSAAEHSHAVAITALKACGTSNTGMSTPVVRAARDTMMGLVQAFPPERGRLEAASMAFTGREETQFGASKQ